MLRKNLLITLCVIAAAMFFYYNSGRAAKVTHGFASYYTFSRLMTEEHDLGRAYDTAYFNAKIHEFGIGGVSDLPNNLPTSSLMFAPISVFSPQTAKIIWTVTSVVLYLISIALLLNIFEISLGSYSSLLLIIFSFLYLPVYHGIELGQAYVLLLFLFTLSLYGLKKDKVLFTSIPLALMLILKGYGVFPLLFLLLIRKWKMFFYTVFSVLGIISVSFLITGVRAWSVYYNAVLFKIGVDEYASYTAYQTVNSFARHVFHMQSSYAIIPVIIFIAWAYIFIMFREKKERATSFYMVLYCSFAGMNVVFAPLAEDYHYALFIPLIFCTCEVIISSYKSVKFETVAFVTALLLLCVPFNYKSLNDASFPLILLAYPRLYGGILLVVLSAVLLRKRSEWTTLEESIQVKPS